MDLQVFVILLIARANFGAGTAQQRADLHWLWVLRQKFVDIHLFQTVKHSQNSKAENESPVFVNADIWLLEEHPHFDGVAVQGLDHLRKS